jgi:hypothetical protein
VGGGGLAGIPAALSAGERREVVCMLTQGLGVAGVGAGSTPAWGIDGGQRRLPRWRELQRGCDSGWTTSEQGVSSESWGRCQAARTTPGMSRAEGSAAALMVAGGGQGGEQRDGVVGEEHDVLLYARAHGDGGVTTGDSAVLRRLGRHRGRTGGPPRARRAYGASAARFEAPRVKEMRREAGLRVARGLG